MELTDSVEVMLSYSDKLNVTIKETSCRPLASAVQAKNFYSLGQTLSKE